MIYLGIDPGTATTGFGVIKTAATKSVAKAGAKATLTGKQQRNPEYEILEFGVVNTKKTDSDAKRLQVLYNDLMLIIRKYKPNFIGIEKLFFTSNQKTAMTVSQARGVALLASQQANIPIWEFTPLQVKNTLCGYGKADKKQVQTMVQRTFQLKQIPKPDDAADALAIALCTAVWKKK